MSNIEEGDLVMVVRGCPHCGNADQKPYVGSIFTAASGPLPGRGRWHCCDVTEDLTGTLISYRNIVPTVLLKKIPPLSELEETQQVAMA